MVQNFGKVDPATDQRTLYDYQSPDDTSEIAQDLSSIIDGEIRFDEYSKQLYATDASAYEVEPIGVVLPRSTSDVKAIMEYCQTNQIPVLPRGGGTSLAGQAVNTAVVLDFSRYMDNVINIDGANQTATVQPGVILDELNQELKEYGLKFAPDPAWADKSTIGGAVGNNSTGAHSLKYGKTDAYIESCEVVLADGTVTTFEEISLDELKDHADPEGDREDKIFAKIAEIITEENDEIRNQFPDLKRNVSGYNLDRLINEAADGTINLGRLLAGSEGTLAIVTEITVSLEPVPETKSAALLCYSGLSDALGDVQPILRHDPAAIEVLDDVLLGLARDTEEFGELVNSLPDGTESILLVEFYAESDSDGKQKVANLISDRVPSVEPSVSPDSSASHSEDPTAIAALEAHQKDRRERFWKLRKSGLPILLSRTSDEKHISFIEDTAVPPDRLQEYISEFNDILSEHDTFASYYAHAGPGVLHIRPLINTKTTDGLESMQSIADQVTDLVVKYNGSVSGEHGDGRARTQWNKKLYGEHLWQVFKNLKSTFDPDWLLNPGQVCGDIDMTENLRFDPEYNFNPEMEPNLEWENENGFQGMVELCHGCGGCRGQQETTGGVMCPTFRAEEEEILSTRGRANMLRQAMSGELSQEEQFSEEFRNEVLDLCIGCKGCAKDCPSEVDMAKLRAELLYEHHQQHGISVRDSLFANINTLAKWGQTLTPLSNWMQSLPLSDEILERILGIAKERSLPRFANQSLFDWFTKFERQTEQDSAQNRILIYPDPYTTYIHPSTGKAAIKTLDALGVYVELPTNLPGTGRPPHSKGLLDKAKAKLDTNVSELYPQVDRGWEIVCVEPSDAVMLQSDYRDLRSDTRVETIARNTYGILEYLDVMELLPSMNDQHEQLVYHGHCHQKSTKKDGHIENALETIGYSVNTIDSTCCGMAGSFGYEAEHYSMSQAIGQVLHQQLQQTSPDTIVAPGTSCRTQIRSLGSYSPVHPIEKVAERID
ncbi:MAG: FAD-binding and (Fe-S)-binding domain-containing protein [Halobacteriaceae archaeon]